MGNLYKYIVELLLYISEKYLFGDRDVTYSASALVYRRSLLSITTLFVFIEHTKLQFIHFIA